MAYRNTNRVEIHEQGSGTCSFYFAWVELIYGYSNRQKFNLTKLNN